MSCAVFQQTLSTPPQSLSRQTRLKGRLAGGENSATHQEKGKRNQAIPSTVGYKVNAIPALNPSCCTYRCQLSTSAVCPGKRQCPNVNVMPYHAIPYPTASAALTPTTHTHEYTAGRGRREAWCDWLGPLHVSVCQGSCSHPLAG